MNNANDILLHWLRDAHAMEKQSEDMLRLHAGRLQHYPECHRRLLEHQAETQWQRHTLHECLDRLGARPSPLRQTGARLLALGNGLIDMAVPDGAVRSLVVASAFEHMEVAVYRAVVAAADVATESEIARTCEHILQEEEIMAEWLDLHVASLTRRYVIRTELDCSAAWH